jgi:hypothetical protein
MFIMFAYGVAGYRISGAPNWVGVERWDIEAKTDGVQERLPLAPSEALLRRLFEDRFQLRTRRETKKMPVYALRIAGQLTLYLDRPVLDRTAIQGDYDFTLKWTPAPNESSPQAMGLAPRAEPQGPADSNGPSIFTALQEQLGLKLESTKGPVDILVIDRVERPSEN